MSAHNTPSENRTDPARSADYVPRPEMCVGGCGCCIDWRNWAEWRIYHLRKALLRARDDMECWGAYASDYIQEKHDLAGDLAAIDTALNDGRDDDR